MDQDAHVWWARTPPMDKLSVLRKVGIPDLAVAARWYELDQGERDRLMEYLNEKG